MKGLIRKLEKDAIDYISQHGGFIDATPGGLVIGKTHGEGGVMVVSPNKDGESIDIVAEIEHGEYIMCPKATKEYKNRLSEINSDNDFNGSINIDDIRLKSVLFTGKTFATIIVMGEEQYIINSKSTAKYLDELERLNNEAEKL